MKRFHILLIGLMVLVSLRFFDARFLDKGLVNYAVLIFLCGSIILSLPHFLVKTEGFVLPVRLIIVSITLSMAMAYIIWEQNMVHTIIETIPYLTWFFFFYLLYAKISVRTIERIIVIYGLVYVCLFLYQMTQIPTVLFGRSLSGDEFTIDRGITRVIFPGGGIFILTVFIAINKLTAQTRHRWFWGLLALLGVLVPIMQATRQFLAGVLIIYSFHFYKGKSFFIKTAIIASAVGLFIFIVTSDYEVFQGLTEAAKSDLEQGNKYIRVLAGKYFLLDLYPNGINRVLGNGAPYQPFSQYGKFVDDLEQDKGYFLSDVGIIGMYCMFGVLAVIGYIIIWIKSFRISLPGQYYYLKYYLWYLLLTSLTWYGVYHYHYLISTVFVLYLYHTIHVAQRKINK